jgi:hypothetical protein
MTLRLLFTIACAAALSGCETPYKKADEADRQPLKHQAHDTSFQAFVGRLRIAVQKKDQQTLASMMAPDFGWRWDAPPPGETPFAYWDQNNLWRELGSILKEPFVPNGDYLVAPAQVVTDPEYRGFRAGVRMVGGSWKLAYFVSGEGAE